MIYKELQNEDLEIFEDKILQLLLDSYTINFKISRSEAKIICLKKIESLYGYINDDRAIVIGCTNNKDLIGFIWLYLHDYFGEKRLHVNEVVVDKEYRGKGVGKTLISEAEEKASKLHVETVDLFVSEINIGALKLYNKLGFQTERRYMKKNMKVIR